MKLKLRRSRGNETHFSSKQNQRLLTSSPTVQGAFTMIEIAIALAVIAFALVAIIGVLPTGINVQKDNREDTIVNQDGPYWIEAIRSGAKGLDHLTNFVESVTIRAFNQNSDVTTTHFHPDTFPGVTKPGNVVPDLLTGERIIGLLSMPKYFPTDDPLVFITNEISARVHALSGAAVEQGTNSRDLGFAYQLKVENVPFSYFAFPTIAHSTNDNSPENLARSNRFYEVKNMATYFADTNANVHELRISLNWPLRADGVGGPNRQQFRSLISSRQVVTNIAGTNMWFFLPQNFVKKTP